jgi:hypothetical protein
MLNFRKQIQNQLKWDRVTGVGCLLPTETEKWKKVKNKNMKCHDDM